MRPRKLLALAVAAAGTLVPVSGRAATTKNIDVRAGEYVAYAVAAVKDDIITWKTTSGNPAVQGTSHEVQSYSGPAGYTPFSSADPSNATQGADGTCRDADGAPVYPCGRYPAGMTPYNTFSIKFGGGTVKYRCTLLDRSNNPYSTLSAEGICSGMCGTITDTPPTLPPGVPTISTPVAGSTLTSQTISITGKATGASEVLIREVKVGGAVQDLARVFVTEDGSWSKDWAFLNGSHSIDAISIHEEGFRSDPSAAVAFTIKAPDSAPPTVRLDKPTTTTTISGRETAVVRSPVIVQGVAFDDVAVAGVTVKVHDNLAQPGTPDTMLTVVLGDGTTQRFFYTQANLTTGSYTITITAKDTSDKGGSKERDVIVLV